MEINSNNKITGPFKPSLPPSQPLARKAETSFSLPADTRGEAVEKSTASAPPKEISTTREGTTILNPSLQYGIKTESTDPVTSGVLKGEFNRWKPEDVKGLDTCDDEYKLNDGFDDSRDIVALYSHEGGTKDPYSFRVDLQDLKYGAENGNMNLYLLVSFPGKEGGASSLPDGIAGSTDHPWKAAISIYDSQNYNIQTPDGKKSNEGISALGFNSQLDGVQFALNKDVLRSMGWKDGEPLHIQAFTTKDFNSQITDTLSTNINKKGQREDFPPPWRNNGVLAGGVDTDSKTGRAKVAFILHGNQSLVKASQTKTWIRAKDGTGYEPVLDAVEKTGVPVEVHLSGTLQSDIEWASPDFNKRIEKDVKDGLLTVEGGTYDEQLMPPFAGNVNKESLKLGKEEAEKLGQKDAPVAWTPERVINSDVLKDEKDAGYQATVADYPDQWFGTGASESKIHQANGMKVFFIDHYFQDHTNTNTDGGLDLSMRGKLLGKALSPDQEQIALAMNDWEHYGGKPFGSPAPVPDMPKAFEKNLAWIAAHPWIQPVTPTSILKEGWKPVNHGSNLNLPTQSYIGGDTMNKWYYGDKDNASYFDYVPRERGWDYGKDPIPSGKKLGDVKTPGTIIYDTWNFIQNAPDNNLSMLARKAFMTAIYETAWHDDSGSPKDISGWERNLAGQIRQAKTIAESALWAKDVKEGKIGPKTTVETKDLDLDGVNEYIIKNDRLFAVMDRVGGTIRWAVVKGKDGFIPVLGNPLTYPLYEGEAEVDRYGDYQRISSLRDVGRDNDIYNIQPAENGFTFTSSDGKIRKTVTLPDGSSSLKASYSIDPSIKEQKVLMGLSPNLEDLLDNGQKNLENLGSTASSEFGAKNNAGGKALIKLSGAKFTETDRDLALTQKVEVTGSNKFNVEIEMGD
ncbi:MAG: hypothetical protein M1536_02410 [Firmicutes bacterium]|nr:hypothetical protein [Bacillota bacterium]